MIQQLLIELNLDRLVDLKLKEEMLLREPQNVETVKKLDNN